MYKIFLQYPDALRVAFPRLREKLDDEDICMYPVSWIGLIISCGLSDGKCHLWIGEKESKKLFASGASNV
jgi:hypothetical protein